MKICTVKECIKRHYALGYCWKHYKLFKKNGPLLYKRNLFVKCKIEGCHKNAVFSHFGYCKFHSGYKCTGLPSAGKKGKLNINWKGGIAEYPNHSEMKRMRKRVLEEENYICYYCGKPTKEIHHIDDSKNNHQRENLHACCHSCNIRRGKPRKVYNSKFRQLYGRNLNELASKLKINVSTVYRRYKNGALRI